MAFTRELQVALEAADLAGRVIRDHYERFQKIPDAPASISTEADRDSQEIILRHLRGAFPDDALCAEETTPTLAAARHTGARLWIVDPIDGTRGFARKNGEFSVMVGFVVDGQIVLGAVLEPALNRLAYAVRDGGCWRRDGQEMEPTRCRVSTITDLSQATLTQSRSHQSGPPTPHFLALNPARTLETYSAGIKLAQVARGEADLYLNTYAAFHDWDICAGQVLVEEAGGRATGLGGEELLYGLPGAPQRYGLLATNGLLHETALATMRGIPLK